MGRKIWLTPIVIVMFMLAPASVPTLASQRADSPGHGLVHSLQSEKSSSGEIGRREFFSDDQTGAMSPWSNSILENNNQPQWLASTRSWGNNPLDTNLQLQPVLQNPPAIDANHGSGIHNEKVPRGSEMETKTTDPKAKSMPKRPSIPNALWIFALGIIGIISVRRTSDHSNVT